MQVVILAAGRGTRMKEFTESTPKPMLVVAGKTLLEHKLGALPQEVDDIVLVIGYLGDMIREHFGESYGGRRIQYVVQENPTGGTANALWYAKGLLTGKFFVMNGDNLYAARDMQACLAYKWAAVVQKKEEVGRAARVVIDDSGRVLDIIENDINAHGAGLINTGLYLLDTRIFEYPQVPKSPGSSEMGLPQTMLQARETIHIQAIPATFWVEIKRPEDLQKAEELLAQHST